MKVDSEIKKVVDFMNYHLRKLIPERSKKLEQDLVVLAFEETVLDYRYHFPQIKKMDVRNNIIRNSGGLAVFLYRLVKKLDHLDYDDRYKYEIHFIMKVLCSCEIYWSTEIGQGLYVLHSMGTVIGSRCKIGKGLIIYQGCTIGHVTADQGKAPILGNDVRLHSNSQILGDIKIGNKVTIASNSVVLKDVSDNFLVAGNPAKIIRKNDN
jgi:serine O-acetyltransferase